MATAYFYATQTKSWRNGAFRTDTTSVYQGMYPSGGSNYNHTGVCWFNAASIKSTLTGQVVDSVRLRLCRASGGVSSARTIYMGRNTHATTLTTAPSGRDGYTNIGSYAVGENKWITLANKFAEGFRDNNDTCFVFYTTDTSDNGYAIFDGASVADATKPYLEITYHAAATAPTAPTSVSITPSVFESTGAGMTMSWSGAKGGTNNAIQSYQVYNNYSNDNVNWTESNWNAGNVTSLNSLGTSIARGQYFRVRIVAKGVTMDSGFSAYSNTVRHNTVPRAPTSFSASPSSYSTQNITLSWSGATAGLSSISKYTIEYSTSTNGSTWGSWYSLTTVSTSATSGSTTVSPTRTVGTYTRYRISVTDTLGAVSESYTTSNSILCSITACGAPTALSVSSTLSESSVTLTWSGASSGTNNSITDYEIQYSESSDNSTWGSWTALTNFESSSTSGSLSVLPPSTRGYYRRFQIRTKGSAGSSYFSGYRVSSNTLRRNTLPSAPSSFTASPSSYSTENITLSWSGAAVGTSAIKQYNIENSTSTDGSTWSGWASILTYSTSTTSGNTTVTPTRTVGTYTRYRVSVTDTLNCVSGYITSNNVLCAVTACTAPTALSVNATLSEGNVTLSWSGAAGGAGNTIIGFEIQYSESSDNSSWGAWTALTTVSTTGASGSVSVAPPSTRGTYRRFQIRTQGSAGSSYYSGWKISSNSLRRNILPTAPMSLSVTPAVYQSGSITLSWSGAVAGTSAIKNYLLQICTSADNVTWGSWSALETITTAETSGSYSYTPGTMAAYTQYRISVTDALDCVSGYRTSAVVKKNNPPTAPSIAAPKAGAITYNPQPRIFITTGTEPDGQRQMVCVKLADGTWRDSVNNPGDFSRSGYLSDKTATIFTHAALMPGTKTISVKAKDESVLAESGETSRSFTVAASPFAQIIANETHVKAAHITVMRTAVNNVRNYYGMTAAVWSEEIVPGKTQIKNWTYHILELRRAVDQIIQTINQFDSVTVFDIPDMEWLPIEPGRPRAAAMVQLHTVILAL